jgi:shikimate 5-dehydrogenase
MVRPATKGTVLCMSLAGHPSNVGTRFHNFLYAELDLDFVYKAFTTTDLAAAIAGIRALGIRGCGVSMPYKEASVELVDELDGVGAGRPQLLVNATPVGMAGGPAADDLPVAPEVVDAAETVLDVVAVPALTPLVRRHAPRTGRSSPAPRSSPCRPWSSSSSTPASAPATTRSVGPRSTPAPNPHRPATGSSGSR